MKQLVILSGKGGTGKTSVAAAFAHLAWEATPQPRTVLADADVDAANLELVLQPDIREEHGFISGSVAVIETERCEGCGLCAEVCRFEAILVEGAYRVDPIACEGCAACFYSCPTEAIHMEPQRVGRWFRSETRYGSLFHAELQPAQDNSGKLVTLVKQQARLHALETGSAILIVDGPPGISCPAISAAAGADLVLIVTEPSLAGAYDMHRALQMVKHFGMPAAVCLNKADLNPAAADMILDEARRHAADVVGQIPFDPAVTQAMVAGEPVTAYAPDSPAARALANTWGWVRSWLVDGSFGSDMERPGWDGGTRAD
jgi:MinD superfamily P-loop ATPase